MFTPAYIYLFILYFSTIKCLIVIIWGSIWCGITWSTSSHRIVQGNRVTWNLIIWICLMSNTTGVWQAHVPRILSILIQNNKMVCAYNGGGSGGGISSVPTLRSYPSSHLTAIVKFVLNYLVRINALYKCRSSFVGITRIPRTSQPIPKRHKHNANWVHCVQYAQHTLNTKDWNV